MATAFDSTADPRTYVPYGGAERVLAALEEWARDPERPVRVLCGPEGSGKSVLLAVLGARIGAQALPVAVSARGLDADTLAQRVLDALGASFEGSPRVALARRVGELGKRRVLLLIDDADELAPRTEMWLFDFVRRGAGALHALLAVRDERMASDLANAFQSGTEVLAIDTPMRREEAEAWVRAELARRGVGEEVRARFDAATLARLHAGSGGWPGPLRERTAALVAETAQASAAAIAAAEEAALEADRAARAAAPQPDAPRAEAGAPAPSPAGAGGTAVEASSAQRPPAEASRGAGDASAAAVPAREAPPRRAASAAGAAAGGRFESSQKSVGRDAPSRTVFGRDGLLRWLVVPAALAAAYVAGFLSSQALETLRARTDEPPALATAPAPGAPEGATPQRDPFTSPPARPAPATADPADPAARGTAPEAVRAGAEAPGSAAPSPPVATAPPPAATPDAPRPPEAEPAARAPESAASAAASAARPEATAAARTRAPAEGPEASPADAAEPARSPQPPPSDPAAAARAPEPGAAREADALRRGAEPSAARAAAARPARDATRSAASRDAEAERREAPRPVSVNVAAEPGASILVDGQAVGSGTVQGLSLAPGPHHFEIRLPDGRVVGREVHVRGTRFNVTVR